MAVVSTRPAEAPSVASGSRLRSSWSLGMDGAVDGVPTQESKVGSVRCFCRSSKVESPVLPESVQALSAMDRPDLDSYNTMRGKYGRLRTEVKRLAESYAEFLAKRNDSPPPKRVRD